MKKLRLKKDGTVKERENKSISFDLTDPFEEELLNYAEEQGVFSRYIKRLITLDMHNKEVVAQPNKFTVPLVPQREGTSEKAKEKMKSLL